MGIRTDPGYKLYIEDNLCFPPNLTPKKLYCTIAGVEKGSGWIPLLPPPFNGQFVCEFVSSGWWIGYLSGYSCHVQFDTYSSTVILTAAPLIDPYFWRVEVPCVFSGENMFPSPADAYINGKHVVTCRPPSLPFAIQSTAADIGVEPARQTMAEISPAADGSLITRLARTSDATCIYIKKETT